MRRALRSVDNVELGQRELADAGQLVDRFLKGGEGGRWAGKEGEGKK